MPAKPDPTLTRAMPQFPLGRSDKEAYTRNLHRLVAEQNDALRKWMLYFRQFEENLIATGDDVFIVLGKNIREQPEGVCPFHVSAIRRAGVWTAVEAPGVVLWQSGTGAFTPVMPTFDGTPLNASTPPQIPVTPDSSVWHVHDSLTVSVIVSEDDPSPGRSLRIATFLQEGDAFSWRVFVEGVYPWLNDNGGGGGGGGSDSSGASSSSSSGSGGSGSGSGSGSKTAIVETPLGFLTWYCVESPSALFEDTLSVPLKDGAGMLQVPAEFLACVDTSTLQVVSVMPDQPAPACAAILQAGEFSLVSVLTSGECVPETATVKIQADARHSPGRWNRTDRETYERNLNFWRQAHE